MAHLLFKERKGTLNLRGSHMNYSRAVKTGIWHQARESEPKDYDISESEVRDLCKSTYRRFGDHDGPVPNTTYQTHTADQDLAAYYIQKPHHKRIVTTETAVSADLDRALEPPENESDAVLPHHNPAFDKMHLETTYVADYVSHFPDMEEKKPEEEADQNNRLSDFNRKCISQFADVGNHRREGRNTWMDESGIYANSHLRRQVYVPPNPITGDVCD